MQLILFTGDFFGRGVSMSVRCKLQSPMVVEYQAYNTEFADKKQLSYNPARLVGCGNCYRANVLTLRH